MYNRSSKEFILYFIIDHSTEFDLISLKQIKTEMYLFLFNFVNLSKTGFFLIISVTYSLTCNDHDFYINSLLTFYYYRHLILSL